MRGILNDKWLRVGDLLSGTMQVKSVLPFKACLERGTLSYSLSLGFIVTSYFLTRSHSSSRVCAPSKSNDTWSPSKNCVMSARKQLQEKQRDIETAV